MTMTWTWTRRKSQWKMGTLLYGYGPSRFILGIYLLLVAATSSVVTIEDGHTSIDLQNPAGLNLQESNCPPNQFACQDGLKCIDKGMVCDNSFDCFDASDESEEECAHDTTCREGSFQCKLTKKCIPNGWVCDGVGDCGYVGLIQDLSDEQDPRCTSANKCQANQFTCSDGITCIDIAELCDGTENCPSTKSSGREDEHKFCPNASEICENAHCKYGCKPSPMGEPLCYCPDGREHDGKECIESNECMQDSACDHSCHLNDDKKKVCSCANGYTASGSQCYAKDVPSDSTGRPALLYQEGSAIKWLSLNGSKLQGFADYKSPKNSGILGLDFDHLNNTVCWITHFNSSGTMNCGISHRTSFWSRPKPYLFSLSDVYHFSFDWIATNIYFLDEALEAVFVCKEHLEVCRIIIDTNIGKPRGLALDPLKGFMFFTVWGKSGAKLERALLNGTNREVLVSNKIVFPQGVTVDLPRSEVYWVDKYLDSIERVDYYGRSRRTIYRGVQHLRDISIFENYLYFVSMQDNSINKLNKFQSTNYTVLATNLSKPFSLKVYHRVRQPRVKHPCSTHGGSNKCQDFCFPFWDGDKPIAQCGCREGYFLRSDGKCIEDNSSAFMVYVKSPTGIIRTVSMKSGEIERSSNGVMIPVVKKGSYSALAFDTKNKTLFYSETDTMNFKILSKGMHQVESRVAFEEEIGHVNSIRLDWFGNVYWVDASIPAIYVSRTNDPKVRKLLIHSNLIRPQSLILNHPTGTMYWANAGSSGLQDGTIEKAWMDGSHREIIAKGLSHPVGLTIDENNKFLYFMDSTHFIIQRLQLSSPYQMKTVATIDVNLYGHPNDFQLYGGWFFIVAEGNILKASVSSSEATSANTTFTNILSEGVSEFLIVDAKSQKGSSKVVNPGCHELPLATPEKPLCACRDSRVLNKDGRTCRTDPNYKSPLECKPNEFKCPKFPKCIPNHAVCDGVDDCKDGVASDEDPNHCDMGYVKQGLCTADSFHCGDSGLCIQKERVCDGIRNCPDGSDESHCLNGTTVCSEQEFQCKISKRCIPKSWTCDGDIDCTIKAPTPVNDSSDEHELCEYPECTQFKCPNSTACIPLDLVCDGNMDCPDGGQDESPFIDCRGYCGRNSTDMFYCELDDKCITKTEVCDGVCQCTEGLDELNCPGNPKPDCVQIAEFGIHDFKCEFEGLYPLSRDDCYNVSCGHHSFKCFSGSQCVPLIARCDGHPDCGDGSDEKNCPKNIPACNFPSKLCDDNIKCIDVKLLCDGKKDCKDGTDEGKLCLSSGKSCQANCTHYCQSTPEGPLCYCPENQYVDPTDPTKCIEIHPCDNFGTCSQICWKYGKKKYQCLCYPGYALKEDGVTCSSVSSESPYLVFSNRHELRGIYLNTSTFQSLISNLRNSIALDFYYHDGKYDIFWSDVVDDKIYKGTLVGGSLVNVNATVSSGLATAEGLAVDWIGENIYWVESNLDQIEVAKINGSFRKTLISGDMVSPRSIAVDPNVGYLFWSDWQTEVPRIERASMSGTHRTKLFNVGSKGEGAWPNGLTLDYVLGRIYWVDARLDSIHTVKYDGTGYQTVLENHEALSHPFSITLFDSTLIWTDWRSNAVMMSNKFGGKVSVIHKTYTQPFDVKVLHPSRQPKKIQSPCRTNNGGCSHLCLISINATHSCGCPHLMTLGPDNRTCVGNEKMLLFSRLNEIRSVYFDKPYYHAAPPISYPMIVMPSSLNYVARDKQVFWCDTQSGETKSSNIAQPSIDTLVDSSAGKPMAIGVDWVSNLIFIALQTPTSNSIAVTNLKGEYFSVILRERDRLKNINSIAVNPYKALIFWAEGVSTSDFKIQLAAMDGSRVKSLSTPKDNSVLDNPASLSYDFTSERLYWVNINSGIVQFYDFGHQKVQQLSFRDLKPHVITVYKDELFFATEKEDTILKGDKTQGGVSHVVRNFTENIYSIRVYDPAEQQQGTNPCADSNECQHLCVPVGQKGVCKCALGYQPKEKGSSKCTTVNPVLVYTDSQGIKGISPSPSSETEELLIPIPLVSFATDVEIDQAKEHLYWLDSEKGKIFRIRRDGTDRTTIHKDLSAVSGLCVDWIARNLYWANPKSSYIEVSHLDGSSYHILVTEDLDKPISLAIDPVEGFLFWSDVVKGVIEKATLDGLNRKVILTSEKASDITVDINNKRLYFCYSTNDKIESVKYDGSDRKMVFAGTPESSHLHSPIVDNEFLYWVDIGDTGGAIMSLPLKNYSDIRVVRKDLGVTIKDLAIFSNGKQTGTNACGLNNGRCEDLCFWNGTRANCFCAHGKLGPDGKSCDQFDAFIAYSRVNSIATVHISKKLSPNDPYPVIQSNDYVRNAIGLTYDYRRSLLFYSDVQLGTINSVSFNGSEFTVVADKQGSVEGLYFESSHSDLYWTVSNDASINRVNPYQKGSKIQKLIKLEVNDKPRGIAVDPCDYRVYWTNWNSQRPSIQRAYLSGYKVESIIARDIRMPNSLVIDQPARKLYWVDARLDKIERCNLDGSNRVVVLRHNPKHAFSLTLYADWVIWTDWVRLAVVRANKYTGEDVEILRNEIPKPMGVVAIAPQEIECSVDPCSIVNGGCQDLCTVGDDRQVVCKCGSGKSMLPDGSCGMQIVGEGGICDGWVCANRRCINVNELCDGVNNCGDNSDETGCGINECMISENPCYPHQCIDLAVGYECRCREGYEQNPQNRTICDITNACLKKKPCSQKCETTPGSASYKCSCVEGYTEDHDKVCRANLDIPVEVIFTNQYYIRMVTGNSSNGSLIHQNLTNAVALDYHWEPGCLYWSDVTPLGSSIRRICAKTGRSEDIGQTEMKEEVLHHAIASPDGIAVDWIAQNLYWCDKGTNTIEVSKLSGLYRKVIISGLQDPRAIVLDPYSGYLYFSDWGEDPMIGKAGMDGTRVQTLISENLGWPNGLTISYETEEIWWADAKEDYIAVSDLNGKNIKIIHSRANNPDANLHHIFSLTTFEDWLYFSDWETRTIERLHKYTGANQTSITSKLIHRPMDVKVFHPYRQRPMRNNPCQNNGGCQNLCLLSPDGGKVCACSENFILNEDKVSCRANCTSSQFVCQNISKCIPKWWRCDAQKDCLNPVDLTAEDEPDDCPPFHCHPGQVQFDNRTCLYPMNVCDGKVDIPETKADEENCNNYTCLSSYYKCYGNETIQSKCISNHQKCDGNQDCPFNDDEESCAPHQCPPTQFQCANGKCLEMSWVCDLEDDCGDGSDEQECTNRQCDDLTKFRCRSGKCISQTWICDGERDCNDGEDEEDSRCQQPASCEKNPSYYLCKDSHKCIPGRWHCDGDKDCKHGDDEEGCSPRNCSESEFRCEDGRCIHISNVCDGTVSCPNDDSDEYNCPVSCNTLTEFSCRNPTVCLPKKFYCDQEIDCPDGSDEENCGAGNITYCDGVRCEDTVFPERRPEFCDEDEYHCSDGTCVPYIATCNGIHECSDDEEGCPVCPFGTCEQKCTLKKGGNRGKTPSASCECVMGYSHDVNKSRCVARGEPATLIIASEDHLLRLNKPHDVDHVDLLVSTSPMKIESIDFLMDSDGSLRLFWSSRTTKSIYVVQITTEGNNVGSRSKRSTSPSEIITGLEDPRGICVDWVTKVLFYIDAGHKTISAASLDGKTRVTVLRGLLEPVDIAVDPNSGRIYWTDGLEGIQSAFPNGEEKTLVAYTPRPTGLAIDHPADRIYFTDLNKNSIESMTLLGKDRQVLKKFSPGTLRPFKLDVFQDSLYFTNYSSNKIFRLQKFGNGNATDITYGVMKASDLVLIQSNKQIRYKDYCIHTCPSFGLCLKNGTRSASCFCHKAHDHFDTSPLMECSKLETVCDLKCKFDGKCMLDNNGRKFCKCQKGYSGPTCEKKSYDNDSDNFPSGGRVPATTTSELCQNVDCKNGGVCEVIENIAYCRCKSSWIGINCEIAAMFNSPCQGRCLHNGLCVVRDAEGTGECKCIGGWYGDRCQRANCSPTFCINGGTCYQTEGSNMLPSCTCLPGFYGLHCESRDTEEKLKIGEEESGLTWILVLVFILVAVSVAGFSGFLAYLIMRRKGRPFMHRRMQDSGTVEISNPMFMKDEGDEDHASEPSLVFDSDKVLLQGTNFANPVYETVYKEGESSTASDEKKGLLQDHHPLADPLS